MGSATSRPKSLSLPARSGTTRLRRTSSQSSSPSLKGSRSDSLAGSIPSTANSSRMPSIDHAEAQSILISEKFHEKLSLPAPPPRPDVLTEHELSLVHASWQMVISDASNICLNFFLQLKKGKPKKLSKSGSSTPLSQSPPPQVSGSKFLLAGSKHSDLIYFALRLSCCIDRLIFHLRLESAGASLASNRKSMPEFLLDESGELQEFLGLDSLLSSDLERLVRTFTETLRLVMIHSQQAKNVWSDDIQSAWTKLLYNLIEVLKNSY